MIHTNTVVHPSYPYLATDLSRADTGEALTVSSSTAETNASATTPLALALKNDPPPRPTFYAAFNSSTPTPLGEENPVTTETNADTTNGSSANCKAKPGPNSLNTITRLSENSRVQLECGIGGSFLPRTIKGANGVKTISNGTNSNNGTRLKRRSETPLLVGSTIQLAPFVCECLCKTVS